MVNESMRMSKYFLAIMIGLSATLGVSAQTEVQKFWKKFKAAVVRNDKKAVASMTRFPLSMPFGFGDVKSRADFIRRYDRIINMEANAKRCFKAQTLAKGADGRWFVGCTFKSEPESSDNRPIVYYFTKTKRGWKFSGLDNINE
jgi:hypothetical protein